MLSQRLSCGKAGRRFFRAGIPPNAAATAPGAGPGRKAAGENTKKARLQGRAAQAGGGERTLSG